MSHGPRGVGKAVIRERPRLRTTFVAPSIGPGSDDRDARIGERPEADQEPQQTDTPRERKRNESY